MLAIGEGTGMPSVPVWWWLPESTVKAFQVRQHRIPWGISQVLVKVGDAKPPGKNSKEKKGAGK